MGIFCSTGGFKTQSFYETSVAFMKAGIRNIELSAGKIDQDYVNHLKQLNTEANLMLHNYFPPAIDPFVLNLASIDENISKRTLVFYKELIEMSSLISSSYVGIHAGFLLDPPVSELGGIIKPSKKLSRDAGMSLFIERVRELSNYANRLNVRLLVENNVLSKANFEAHGDNMLLLVDGVEVIDFMKCLGGEVGLLLGVGHLKVSANTLGFELIETFHELSKFAEGYHLSENHGKADDHLGFEKGAWFMNILNPKISFATLEIDNLSPVEIANLSTMLESHLAGMR